MNKILNLKRSFDDHQIDENNLSSEQIVILYDMYKKDISKLDMQISDIKNQIEQKKNKMKKQLEEIKKINNDKISKNKKEEE